MKLYNLILTVILILIHLSEIKPQYDYDYSQNDYGSDYGSIRGSSRQSNNNQWANLAPTLRKIGICFLDCTVSFIKTPECREIFPCGYFCFIDNVKTLSRYHAFRRKRSVVNYQSRPSNQPAFSLQEVQRALLCVYHCAKKVDIENWTTFTEVMYCVVDVCLCSRK